MNEHYANRGKRKTFAGRYYCYQLVYFERYSQILVAINREKEIKDYSREKKMLLIKATNPKLNFIKVAPE